MKLRLSYSAICAIIFAANSAAPVGAGTSQFMVTVSSQESMIVHQSGPSLVFAEAASRGTTVFGPTFDAEFLASSGPFDDVALLVSSEHEAAGVPHLADSNGRLVAYRLLIDGTVIEPDDIPVALAQRVPAGEQTRYQVALQVSPDGGLEPGEFHDTVMLTVAP
jgi:hypothetical protein